MQDGIKKQISIDERSRKSEIAKDRKSETDGCSAFAKQNAGAETFAKHIVCDETPSFHGKDETLCTKRFAKQNWLTPDRCASTTTSERLDGTMDDGIITNNSNSSSCTT